MKGAFKTKEERHGGNGLGWAGKMRNSFDMDKWKERWKAMRDEWKAMSPEDRKAKRDEWKAKRDEWRRRRDGIEPIKIIGPPERPNPHKIGKIIQGPGGVPPRRPVGPPGSGPMPNPHPTPPNRRTKPLPPPGSGKLTPPGHSITPIEPSKVHKISRPSLYPVEPNPEEIKRKRRK